MVIFVYGTTGELIKIAPLVNGVEEKESLLIDTFQQPKLIEKFREATGFRRDNIVLTSGGKGGRDLESITDAIGWFLSLAWNTSRKRLVKKIKDISKNEPTIIAVHGDTMTTVYGAVIARMAGVPFTHIEAGLRSGNWRHPFPEEIDRRIVSKLARKKDIHFPPAKHAEEALRKEKVKGEIVNTRANTVADSAIWASKIKKDFAHKLPRKYVLISVHRNEFLVQPARVEGFCKTIQKIADNDRKVVFLDHPITKARITELKLNHLLESSNIIRIPKLDYVDMISALERCESIITDSGGLQEESYYLGKPCVVFREHSERDEGIGSNVVLSGINEDRLLRIMTSNHVKKVYKSQITERPTDIIITHLKARGYLS